MYRFKHLGIRLQFSFLEASAKGKFFFPLTLPISLLEHYPWYIKTCVVPRKACLPSCMLGKGTDFQFYCNLRLFYNKRSLN